MAVDVVRWYDLAGTRLVSARNPAEFNPNIPYFTRVGGDQSMGGPFPTCSKM